MGDGLMGDGLMGFRRIVAALVLGATMLVGCGGDGDGTASPQPATDGATDSATGLPADLDERCVEAAAAMAAAIQSIPQAFGADATEQLGESIAAFRAFADNAPAEIRDDLQTVAEGYAEFATAITESGFDPTAGQTPSPETLAAVEAATQRLQASELQDAANRVAAWFDENCPT